MHSDFLDRVQAQLETKQRESIYKGMALLFQGLDTVRKKIHPEQWNEYITFVQNHNVYQILLECPFNHHARQWPRGYAGDAEMLDMIYGYSHVVNKWPHTTDRGWQIFDYQYSRRSANLVRVRRTRIARTIDRVVHENTNAKVLSMACGHLREGILSLELQLGRVKRFVALDQDKESLKLVKKHFSHLGVQPICDTIGLIIKKRLNERFDFIYATGLFDYLNDSIAVRLIQSSLEILNSGGCLLIANFASHMEDIGFMEAIMNWRLIYRSLDSFKKLANALPENMVADIKVYPEGYNQENDCLLYLEVIKA